MMDAFAKSDDERDFYLDKIEGFIVFIDLDKIAVIIPVVGEAVGIAGDQIAVIDDRDGTCMVMLLAAYLTLKCHGMRREGEGSYYCKGCGNRRIFHGYFLLDQKYRRY
jgi:hypothetical protein